MECEIGSYTDKGIPIPEEALCLYITPNPRSYKKSAKNLAKKLLDLCFNEYNGYNPHAEALNSIQTACSRTVFMDFDFDGTTIDEMKDSIFNIINRDCVTFVETRGGFHLLIEVDKIDSKYFKTYYTKWPAGGRNAYKFQLEEIENNETTWEEVVEYLYKDNPIINKDYLINWFKDRYEIPVKR